jgi:hypothetical protein
MLKTLLRTWVRGNVYRKGLSGNSPLWTAVGLIGVLRYLKGRFSGAGDPPVFASPLRSGERIDIVHTGAPERRLRRDRRREAALLRRARTRLASPRRRPRMRTLRRISGTRLEQLVDPSLLAGATARRRRPRRRASAPSPGRDTTT